MTDKGVCVPHQNPSTVHELVSVGDGVDAFVMNCPTASQLNDPATRLALELRRQYLVFYFFRGLHAFLGNKAVQFWSIFLELLPTPLSTYFHWSPISCAPGQIVPCISELVPLWLLHCNSSQVIELIV